MNNLTIIYLTDNSISAEIDKVVKRELVRAAEGKRIVSVSHKPIDLGDNICLGEIGRSWISLYKGILAGIEATTTPYIAIAEHDCLYTPEHFNFKIPNDKIFWYNVNVWLAQWGGNHPELNGMYSYYPKRHVLSQLMCRGEMLKQSTEEVLNLLDMGLKVERGMKWYGEPGLVSAAYRAFVEAKSGRSSQLQKYLKDYVTKYESQFFETKMPNLDIRHSTNFTGPKRGKQRCYTLPYWGDLKKVME